MTEDAAVETARAALAAEPKNPRLMDRLAKALVDAAWSDTENMGPALKEAGRLFTRLAKLEPDNAAHLVNLGAVRSDQGQSRQALDLYRRAEAMGWQDGNLDYNIAICLIDLGEHEAGRRRMRRAAERRKHPATRDAYFDPHGY